MRIAFDATSLPDPRRRVGAGVYVTELLAAVDPLDVELHVFVNARDADDLGRRLPRATLHPVRLPNRPARLAWAHGVLPVALRRLRPDVFHGPHYSLPPALPCPGTVTFHDPTFFTIPNVHERSKVAYFTRAARSGIRRASRVIAVSEYSARGAVEHAGADPGRVDVVLEGVDPQRYRPGPAPGGEPYLLFVGALEPRKDVPTLIRAYGRLAEDGLEHRLVVVGPRAWGARAVDAAITELRAGRVEVPSFVPEDRKIELFRGAAVFVYPSIAEGFGLPVLEAMACGAPVVTTTGSAPAEVAGDAAVLVPPGDTDALCGAIRRVLFEGGLAQELRTRGLARAGELTWARAAEQTVRVWHRAAA